MAKDKKAKRGIDEHWIEAWCRDNVDELLMLGTGWATVHPTHGIIGHDTMSMLHLMGRNRFIKRSIIRDCAHIDVGARLGEPATKKATKRESDGAHKWSKKHELGDPAKQIEDPPYRPDGLPPLERPYDLFDVEAHLDTARADEIDPMSEAGHSQACPTMTTQTVMQYAAEHGLKATDVLLCLIELGVGVHVHTVVTAEMLAVLEERWPGPTLPIDAKTSPHVQPKFTPRDHMSGRDVVMDGYGSRSRGLRFD